MLSKNIQKMVLTDNFYSILSILSYLLERCFIIQEMARIINSYSILFLSFTCYIYLNFNYGIKDNADCIFFYLFHFFMIYSSYLYFFCKFYALKNNAKNNI